MIQPYIEKLTDDVSDERSKDDAGSIGEKLYGSSLHDVIFACFV